MNDTQIWATIIGTFWLGWHAVNIVARVTVTRAQPGRSTYQPTGEHPDDTD